MQNFSDKKVVVIFITNVSTVKIPIAQVGNFQLFIAKSLDVISRTLDI